MSEITPHPCPIQNPDCIGSAYDECHDDCPSRAVKDSLTVATPARPGAVTEAQPVAWEVAWRDGSGSLYWTEDEADDAVAAAPDGEGTKYALTRHTAHPPAAASPEPGAVEVLNELAAAAQEYGNSGSTNSMRRLFAARERADDLLTLRTATPRADATAGVSVDLSDLSRDQLETAYKQLRQASDAALLFFNRYKKPPLSAPSCLRCGRQTTVYAVQHLEIPSVVLCPACAPHATAGGVREACSECYGTGAVCCGSVFQDECCGCPEPCQKCAAPVAPGEREGCALCGHEPIPLYCSRSPECPHADAAARDTRDDVIAAANTLYDRVESLFYAAPETHSYHYDRITKAMQAYAAARRAAQPETSGGEVPSSQTEEPTPPAIRRCNRHDDCDAADAKARAQGRAFAEHCHDDCCEECFGY